MYPPTLRLYDGYDHTSSHLKSDVLQLQSLLRDNQYSTAVDGMFGPNTEKAVLDFQVKSNLLDDGIVGPVTWSVLLKKEKPIVIYYDTTYAMDSINFKRQSVQAEKYKEFIYKAAEIAGVPSCLIMGIGSRESHWGLLLKPPGPEGTGDFIRRSNSTKYRKQSLPPDGGGYGRGLMQIDFDAHEFARTGDWKDPEKNILYAAKVLLDNINFFKDKGPWTKEEVLVKAVAAYNCGPGNVLRAIRSGLKEDYFTHGRDYSENVFNRAGWFQRKGW